MNLQYGCFDRDDILTPSRELTSAELWEKYKDEPYTPAEQKMLAALREHNAFTAQILDDLRPYQPRTQEQLYNGVWRDYCAKVRKQAPE